ncbi:MAG: ATP F0F1 synthase subunit B [Rhizobiales bacterium]|nr:ATP F0F1 synthase subunit B [Hyphomicrobiales bacterium]MBI3673618.1 ATP F0F1 synthase subunit B [Hyphomicrobiales bacterium]
MSFFREAESWVLVAFLLFIALLVYLKVPAMAAKMLDERSARIAKELDEARKLREEAEALLAAYEKKRAEAEKLAADIVAQARADAVDYGIESRRKMGDMLDRLTKHAEQQIAQAEAAAVKEVRNAVIDVAVAAAETLTADAVKGAKGAALVDQSIAAVKSRLN